MARMRITIVAATATIAAFAAPTSAFAVTTDCDGLQDALDNNANAVVTLAEGEVCDDPVDLPFVLPQREIRFEGAPGATLDGGGEEQLLRGDGVGATTISTLTFRDGVADGEAIEERSGGAISLTGSSPVTLEGNKFFSNEADLDGGAVSILEFQQVGPIEEAGNVEARGDGPSIVLRGDTFGGLDEGNAAGDEGGAVYIDTFRNVEVDGNAFAYNEAEDDGGGMEIEQSGHASLTGNRFSYNHTFDNGGGAAIESCTAELVNNIFDLNEITGGRESSPDGAGLYLDGSSCNDLLRSEPSAPAAVIQAGNRFLANAIDGNGDSGSGGGEYISDTTVESTNDRFVGNRIDDFVGLGGGLYFEGEDEQPFTARNLVAAGNEIVFTQPSSRGLAQTEHRGGGLFLNGDESEFRIEDSTIEGNAADDGSGIAGEFFGGGKGPIQTDTIILENSIVFGNTGESDIPQLPFDGEVSGFLEREVQFSDFCADGAPSPDGAGNICAEPKLAGETDDENVDQTTASPTIDKGDSTLVDADLVSDYAGDGRVLGAKVDMGADEYKPPAVQQPTPPVITPTPTVTTPAPAPAPAAGGVLGTQQRSCTSRRAFRIRIRVPRGEKALSATVRVNNKKVKVVRGKRLRAPVRLRGLPKGRFTVRITLRLADGNKLTGVRTYHTCIPKLPGDGPPKL